MDVFRRLQGEKLAKDKIKKYITGADFNMNNIQANNIMGIFMDNNNKDNIFKNTIHKINKIGEKKLRGIKDNEEIQSYTYLLMLEYLNSTPIDHWNSLSDKQKERSVIAYCNNKYNQMSRDESINNNITYNYDKETDSYTYCNMHNVDIDEIIEHSELNKENKYEDDYTTLTRYIFDTYINKDNLTRIQLIYVDTYKNNYIAESGEIRDMRTNEELYSKQASHYMKNVIYDKLNDKIENDQHITVNNNNRWVYNK